MRDRIRPRQTVGRCVLAGAFAGALVASMSACGPADEADDGKRPIPHQSFVSRPDLTPPQVAISRDEAGAPEGREADGHIFLTPNYGTDTPSDGAVILDSRGELVWMMPSEEDDPDDNLLDLRVQEYLGEPVLTVYQGNSDGGRGHGEVLILDDSYEEIARVTTGGSLESGNADLHDTTITDNGTMLIASYVVTPADLSSVGGPEDGYVEDAVVQEVDVATGEVVFEWRALDHVPVSETLLDFGQEQDELEEEAEEAENESEEGTEPPELGTREEPFDYFHINSVTEDHDGSLLVSARHTSAVYRLDRTTGDVDWTLGGSASDFEMGQRAMFAWQHDAQRAPDGTLTLLDNHAHGAADDESSRGLRLALDEEAMTASVVTEYLPPVERVSGSMANAQQLPNGNMMIGWGARPYYSEYTHDGELLYDVCHGDVCYGEEFEGGGSSYRAYKFPWQGHPADPPDVVIREAQPNQDQGEERVAYVSWNGATEVAQWRLVAGDDEADTGPVTTVDRQSFETAIPVLDDAQYIAVEALDAEGTVLATGTPEE